MLLAKRTGSPGRVAAELREYEVAYPAHGDDSEAGGHAPDHQPAE
jgi:hypothetical protein